MEDSQKRDMPSPMSLRIFNNEISILINKLDENIDRSLLVDIEADLITLIHRVAKFANIEYAPPDNQLIKAEQ